MYYFRMRQTITRGHLLSVLVLPCMWSLAVSDDCPFKECTCDYPTISCDSLNLKSIPQKVNNVSYPLGQLSLDDNPITTIPAGSLPANLSQLRLFGNPIQTIDDAAFDESINTLQSIIFAHSTFTQIPKAVLNLNNLQTLSFSYINIASWDVAGMSRLASTVTSLDLDYVGLTEWPEWLKIFSKLNYLSVSGNPISTLPDDAMDAFLNSLVSLELYDSQFTSVPKALSGLTKLNQLSMSINLISDVTWLPPKSNLSSLTINNNKISNASALSNVLRPYANSLSDLDINDNYLTAIPDLSFLPQLDSLDFSNNHISDPNSGAVSSGTRSINLENNVLSIIPRVLKQLQVQNLVLSLVKNHFTSLQGADFPNSTNKALFGYNLITELTDSSFPQGSVMTYLDLSNNPLSKISPLAFQNLANLTQLYLRATKLARMPLAIASLTSLEVLDVTGCRDLVCTCEEKKLAPRITSLSQYNVYGECGQTNVFTFFNELSRDCP